MTDGRPLLADNTRLRLQEYMDRYQTGINVSIVNVKEARAPAAVQAAFDDVQKANLDKERFVNEAEAYANTVIPESRGTAQRMLEEANAYRDQVVAAAQGEASRFEKLLVEYDKAPEVTRERLYIDAISSVYSKSSKILVDIDGGNNMLYLPLDKLTAGAGAGAVQRNVDDQSISDIADQVIEEIRSRNTRSNREER
jgi:membrane protease subunit HflK